MVKVGSLTTPTESPSQDNQAMKRNKRHLNQKGKSKIVFNCKQYAHMQKTLKNPPILSELMNSLNLNNTKHVEMTFISITTKYLKLKF